MGARFFLETGENPHKPVRWPDGESTVAIGRGEDCFLRLRDDQASRRHATITRRFGRYVLRDLNSRNGTLLDDRPVKKAVLTDGARIRIGNAVLRFSEEEELGVGPAGAVAFDGIGGEERMSLLCVASVGLGVLGVFFWQFAAGAFVVGALGWLNARLRPLLGGMWLGALGAALGGAGFAYHCVAGGLAPAWRTWGAARMQVVCRQRMREVQEGLARYRAENDGRSPARLDDLYPRYVPDRSRFYCPAAEARAGEHAKDAAYAYDPSAMAARRHDRWVVRDPSVECHVRGGNVLFPDGQVRWLKRHEFVELQRAGPPEPALPAREEGDGP